MPNAPGAAPVSDDAFTMLYVAGGENDYAR
jgi:hypothetical protein